MTDSALGNLEGTSLELALGVSATKALIKHKEIRFINGTKLTLVTERTIGKGSRFDSALVIYADMKMMDWIDNVKGMKFIAVVSYERNIEQWIKTWNPIIHGKESKKPAPLLQNKVIETALKNLTSRVNLANKSLHPSDEAAAKDLFRILRRHNEKDDPQAIRAWAVRYGWSPKGADALQKMAGKILYMVSKPAVIGRAWANDVYERWSNPSDET